MRDEADGMRDEADGMRDEADGIRDEADGIQLSTSLVEVEANLATRNDSQRAMAFHLACPSGSEFGYPGRYRTRITI